MFLRMDVGVAGIVGRQGKGMGVMGGPYLDITELLEKISCYLFFQADGASWLPSPIEAVPVSGGVKKPLCSESLGEGKLLHNVFSQETAIEWIAWRLKGWTRGHMVSSVQQRMVV